MDYIKAVRTGISYVEKNIDSNIALNEVASVVGLSQWHFQRIFKAITNETLKTYIRSRRLANSLDKLLLGKERILDIALSAGYESQESFTRAFKAMFGMNPNEYRRIGDRNLFLKKIEFDENYLTHINNNIFLVPEIEEKNIKKIVGIKTRFYGVDSDKNNIAEKLPPLWNVFLQRLGEIKWSIQGVCYGVVNQVCSNDELLEYYAGIEVQKFEQIPEGMDCIEVPAATYAKFAHRGPTDQIDNTVNFIYSSWLLPSGFSKTQGPDLEIYGCGYNPDSSESVMHYAIPIV